MCGLVGRSGAAARTDSHGYLASRVPLPRNLRRPASARADSQAGGRTMVHRHGLVLVLIFMLTLGFLVGIRLGRVSEVPEVPGGSRPSAPFPAHVGSGGCRPGEPAAPGNTATRPVRTVAPQSEDGHGLSVRVQGPQELPAQAMTEAAPHSNAALYSCACDYDRVIRAELPYPSGADIACLQTHLATFGFDPGPPDGVYGPRTAAAVAVFQRSRGLEPDGVLGPRTWIALGKTGASLVAQGPAPPPPGRVEIVIDTVDRTLTILSDGKPYRQFPVAVGKPSTPSPQGQWKVVSKGAWSGGFGTRWMGLDVPWGKYGIHGTNKPWYIGDAVSGGCVRMLNHDVELIFEWVQIGTPVVICGNPFGPLRNPRRELGPGERGTDVLAAQRRLRMLGFDLGPENGMYEQPTIDAVKAFQELRGLRVTGVVTPDTYDALGLYLFE